MERLGQKLRKLRLQRGLTVRELASELGIKSRSHISDIETGKRKPSLDLLVKIMGYYDVSCDKLLNDEFDI